MFPWGIRRIWTRKFASKRKDGGGYEGKIIIGETQFAFELQAGERVGEIEGMKPSEIEKIIREVVVINIYKEGHLVELTNREYYIFYNLLFSFLISFCKPLKDCAGKYFRAEKVEPHLFKNESCDLLSQPKFGCKIRYEETILRN